MKTALKFSLFVIFAYSLMSCAEKKKKKFHHSAANYKTIDRHPSAGEHAPIMENILDKNLYDACRRERSERYCKRRLGTWRQ